nr:FAD-binding protein [Sedimentibacter sp.]
MNIEDAKVLVSGGRGMHGPENYPMLEELKKEKAKEEDK